MDTHLRITETEKMENNLSLSSELKKGQNSNYLFLNCAVASGILFHGQYSVGQSVFQTIKFLFLTDKFDKLYPHMMIINIA